MKKNVSDLKDGEVAIIRSWGVTDAYIGRLVQRHGNILLTIGKKEGNGWGEPWDKDNNFAFEDKDYIVETVSKITVETKEMVEKITSHEYEL